MKTKIVAVLVFALAALLVAPVLAVGQINVSPSADEGITLTSPADFTVYMGDSKTSYDPHIFLVMTEDCMDGLVGNVVVTWTGGSLTVLATDWNYEDGLTEPEPKLPPNTVEGAGYTVSSLQSHLETSEGIYWAFLPFLGGVMLSSTPIEFTVTINSDSTAMLVYVLGKASETDTLFTDRVPPTNPGFVVPEVATIMLAIASISALGLYALKRKNK
jgi:hypothetical protein